MNFISGEKYDKKKKKKPMGKVMHMSASFARK
jgi:hypothetical protein